MSFFRMLFVIMLCVPVAYLALRLIIVLIDELVSGSKKRRRARR